MEEVTTAHAPTDTAIPITPPIPYSAIYTPFVDKKSNSSLFEKQEFNSILLSLLKYNNISHIKSA
jgi:hypothetical protein